MLHLEKQTGMSNFYFAWEIKSPTIQVTIKVKLGRGFEHLESIKNAGLLNNRSSMYITHCRPLKIKNILVLLHIIWQLFE